MKEKYLIQIKKIIGDRLVINQNIRNQHGDDQTWNRAYPPDAVAFVHDAREIQKIIHICNQNKIPVIAFGEGTSLEGHITAPNGGICINCQNMKKIIKIRPDDFDCDVEPGVTRKQLEAELKQYGLFFPVDPGADASIGGMVATRASGTTTVRYGSMRDNVIALEIITPNAKIIKTANRAKKSAAGYDLTRLFTGTEGTLGIITKITLKIYPIPEYITAARAAFPNVDAAVNTAINAMQCAIPIARIELLDKKQIKACNNYAKLSLPEKPHLFVEFHGTKNAVDEQINMLGEIVKEYNGDDFKYAHKTEERNQLWKARHDAFWAAKAAFPQKKALSTDICVPLSQFANAIRDAEKDLKKSNIDGIIVGHVGDGNFHVLIFLDENNQKQIKNVTQYCDRLAQRAIKVGGTCTGEHGIGIGKINYMIKEHGEETLKIMKTIKNALDPNNIMNPGKIFPENI